MNKKWLKAACVRAVKTFFQTAVALVTVGVPVLSIEWTSVLSVAATAAVVSIMTSLGGLPEVEE